MTATLATILYEDRRGPTGQFGFHRFLCRCAADDLGRPLEDIEARLDGRPLKGDGNVLTAIRRNAPRIARDGRRILAVFDGDKVRRLLGLDAAEPDDRVVDAILEPCPIRDRVDAILLTRNMESVLQAVHACAPRIGEARFTEAIARKSRTQRDNIFSQIAFGERAVRDCVLDTNTSVRAIRDWMVHLFAGRSQLEPGDA